MEIDFNNQGATIVYRNHKPQRANFLLPANKLWVNTGVRVKPNQKLKISASGSVNLAIHHLVDAARAHEKAPFSDDVGPEGGLHPDREAKDMKRAKCMIIPDLKLHGALIACILPEGKSPADEYYRPHGMKLIGRQDLITSDTGGVLWLTVNDCVLSPEDEDAFTGGGLDALNQTSEEMLKIVRSAAVALAGPPSSVGDCTVALRLVQAQVSATKAYQLRKRWRKIVDDKYWDVYFKDNFGYFLVQIEFGK
jgi:hypothetical protein